MSQNKLNKLHEELTTRYSDILSSQTEDPRLLKEIREFLSDNNITAASISNIVPEGSNESVELDDDYIGDFQIAK